MTVPKLKLFFCVIAFSVLPLTAFGQTPGFIDQVFDFEDQSLNGFVNGAAPGPFVIADATGNSLLEVVTSGAPAGPGNAVVVFNNAFTGDLSSANSVLFDATNPNETDLNVRFSFSDPSNVFISDDILLSAGSTQNLAFDLSSSDFVQASGFDPFAQTLSNVSQIRLLSNPNVALGGGAGLAQGAPILDLAGNPVAGSFLVDNFVISSAAVGAAPAPAGVPEPSCVSLLLGLAAMAAAGRRRKI